MAGIDGLKRIQFGKESTWKTEVDATTIWRGKGDNSEETETVFPEETTGYISGLGRSYIPYITGAIELSEIEATFDQSGVIVIRDQKITPQQQIVFARQFGDIEVNYNSGKYGLAEHPEIYKISNITKDNKPIGSRRAGENWHSDMI